MKSRYHTCTSVLFNAWNSFTFSASLKFTFTDFDLNKKIILTNEVFNRRRNCQQIAMIS